MAVISEGARLLGAVNSSQEQIAVVAQATQSAVAHWIVGDTKPTRARREILYAEFGIAPDTWDRPARTERPFVPPVEDVDEEAGLPRAGGEAEQLVRKTILELDAIPIEEMNANALMRRATVRAQCAQILARQTGEGLEITESKLVRLPSFRRVVDALLRSLEKWPEAMASAGAELKRLGGDE